MSIATTVPQRSQGTILLSITSLAPEGAAADRPIPPLPELCQKPLPSAETIPVPRVGRLRPAARSLGQMDHQPFRRKYGSAHHPNSCSKMRPNSPNTRCRKTYAQASDRRCFS